MSAILGLRILIDATTPESGLELFGMTLLERQLRSIASAGLEPTAVHVVLRPGAPKTRLPESANELFALKWISEPGSLCEHIDRVLREKKDAPLMVLDAASVVDARLFQSLAAQPGTVAARGDEGNGHGNGGAAVLRIDGPWSPASKGERDLPHLVTTGISQGAIAELPLSSIPSYIKKLRRNLPVYLFPVKDTDARNRAERFLFWSNYKGSTDFFTKYVYPPLVWRMVRPLSHWRVHPNVISLFNVAITFLAVPFFAWDWWWLGFLCAYTMSVLDSVDGKLARLTFRASWFGNILDHGLDLVHPPFWYFGWAWGLADGDTSSPIFHAAIWMAVLYVLDRIVAGVFNRRLRRSIHGYTPLDERMRTFISRRNINLPAFVLGWVFGVPVETFLVLVAWQAVCFVFHLERLVQYWNAPPAALVPAPR